MSQPSEGPAGEASAVTNSDDAFLHFSSLFSTCFAEDGIRVSTLLSSRVLAGGEDMDRTPFFLDARVYDGGRRRILI